MKIILADDHCLFRESLACWIKQYNNKIEFDFSGTYSELLRSLKKNTYDMILLNLFMSGMQGVVSFKRIRSESKKVPIIVVSQDEDNANVSDCLNAGALAYVVKSSSGKIILEVINDVIRGMKHAPVNVYPQNKISLNDKKKRILILINDGFSNKVIAERLFLSEGTVKQYVSQIFRLLQVSNRTQAALKARELLEL